MMEWVMNLIGQMLGVAEILIIVEFLVRFLGWKKGAAYRKIWICMLVVLLYLVAQFNGMFRHSHVIVLFIYFLILFTFSSLLLEEKWEVRLLGCLFPFMVITIIDILFMQISAFLHEKTVNLLLMNINLPLLISVLLTKVFLWYILRKIRLFLKKNVINLTKKFYLIANGLIILDMGIEILLFYVINSGVYESSVNAMLIAVSAGIMIISIYIGYSIFKMSEQDNKILKYELIQLQTQEREQQIEEFKRSYSRIRQFTHDYKNHCMSMQKLLEDGNYEELDKYLQSITGRYLELNCEFVNTNNPLIDAILNSKMYQCRENKIEMTCTISGDISTWDKLEIGIILFNLLDNAIESCMNEEAERKIEFILKREKEASNITIKNVISKSVLERNPGLQTIKPDQGMHGIGHTTVAGLAEELNGMVEYYEEDSKFCVHVFLPL